MPQLLLVSTSTTHGTDYLDHCEEEVRELFPPGGRLLFVPFALRDRDRYATKAAERFARLGLALESIHRASDPRRALEEADGLFVGGGNTFRLLLDIYRHDLLGPIKARVAGGMPYMGTSAGSNIACPSLKTTNDMPIVQPPSFEALGLVPFQINPHYQDPDTGSTHMGETRDRRLEEFLEENDLPVVALREGAMLRRRGTALRLLGAPGGKLFRRGATSAELGPDTVLDELLRASPSAR